MLEFSADTERIEQHRCDLEEREEERKTLAQKLQDLNVSARNVERELEQQKTDLKRMKQQKEHKNVLKAKLGAKEAELRRYLASQTDTKAERRSLEKRKVQMAQSTVKLATELKRVITSHQDNSFQLEVMKISEQSLTSVIESKKREITDKEDGLKGVKQEVQSEEDNYKEADAEFKSRLAVAHNVTGKGCNASKVPHALAREFEEQAVWLPATVEEVQVMLDEYKGQLACLEDVDEEAVSKYNNLQETAAELRSDIARYERKRQNAEEDAVRTRERWLTKLHEMVGNISARFSDYFASMGFDGEVALYEGNHETDYANFGIDILVKYRDNLQLQKLTPHLQSGGERSVATALYMLALQELTVVPFRCVDEINQGMDAVNERRVFDLLVRTSCKETSAQYFLLTPKLLSNLNYDENMTVLVVNNGEGMCHHSDWDVDRFIAAASRA